MNTQTVSLDVTKPPAMLPVVRIGQGDRKGTVLKAEIYDDGTALALSGYTVRFCMRLPDGKTYYEVDGSKVGNVATFTIDESKAGAVPGKTDVAYIEVISGETVVCSTSRLTVVVLDGAKAGAEPAASWVSAIDAARTELEALTTQSENARLEYELQESQQAQAFASAQASRQQVFEQSEAARQQSYQQAESSRNDAFAAAETSRAAAERDRVDAEDSRASAEGSRATAESSRASAEASRSTRESSRASAESARASAEASRAAAEQQRASAEQSRASAEGNRASAESARASAESARVAEEARRVAEFANMEARASGWYIHYCTQGEYDEETRKPTVADPDAGTLYLTPSKKPEEDNIWTEWVWDTANSRWELHGTAKVAIDPITPAQVDTILAGEPATTSEVMTASGLSYLVARIGELTIGQL